TPRRIRLTSLGRAASVTGCVKDCGGSDQVRSRWASQVTERATAARRAASCRMAQVSVAQLLIPAGSAALRGEIEQVPQRLEGADVAGFLPRLLWRVEQLRGPEVADRVPVAVEHVQHRPLLTVRALGQVVAVIGGPGRGQHAQPPPAAF